MKFSNSTPATKKPAHKKPRVNDAIEGFYYPGVGE